MPLTTAQMVRERIGDIPTLANDTYYGDGYAVLFALPHRNLTSASAFVQGSNAWTNTGATFNASGYVTFASVISANSAFRAQYMHSVFSDELIDQRVSALGNVLDVSLEFARDLLFDSVKRAKWVAPDSSEYDDTKAIDAVKAIIADIKAEQEDQAASGGGFGEWAITQGEL